MPALSRLIKIWALGRAISLTAPSLKHLLSGLAAIAVLGIIASVLMGAFVVGGLYFLFHVMTAHGVDPVTAMATLAFTTGLLIDALLLAAWRCWCNITDITRMLSRSHSPLSERVTNVVHGFLTGLLGEEM